MTGPPPSTSVVHVAHVAADDRSFAAAGPAQSVRSDHATPHCQIVRALLRHFLAGHHPLIDGIFGMAGVRPGPARPRRRTSRLCGSDPTSDAAIATGVPHLVLRT